MRCTRSSSMYRDIIWKPIGIASLSQTGPGRQMPAPPPIFMRTKSPITFSCLKAKQSYATYASVSVATGKLNCLGMSLGRKCGYAHWHWHHMIVASVLLACLTPESNYTQPFRHFRQRLHLPSPTFFSLPFCQGSSQDDQADEAEEDGGPIPFSWPYGTYTCRKILCTT